MVAIVTHDLDLLSEVWRVVVGDKAYITAAASSRTLCGELEELQPEVVILDVRLGGNVWRAIEAAPGLRRLASRPEVVLLAPYRMKLLRRVASESDCYSIINLDDETWDRRLASVVEGALRRHEAESDDPLASAPVLQ